MACHISFFVLHFYLKAICFCSMAFSPNISKKENKKERRDAIEGGLMDFRCV